MTRTRTLIALALCATCTLQACATPPVPDTAACVNVVVP
jgi:hypothetical protein